MHTCSVELTKCAVLFCSSFNFFHFSSFVLILFSFIERQNFKFNTFPQKFYACRFRIHGIWMCCYEWILFFSRKSYQTKKHIWEKKNEKYRSTHKFVCFDDDNFGCVLFDVCHKKNYMKRPIIHSGENSMTNRATNHCDPWTTNHSRWFSPWWHEMARTRILNLSYFRWLNVHLLLSFLTFTSHNTLMPQANIYGAATLISRIYIYTHTHTRCS